MTNYVSQQEIGNLSLKDAAGLFAILLGGAMAGRFVGSALLQRLRTQNLLAFNAIGAAVLVTTSMLSFGYFAMWSLILVGLFNSIMFPSIFTLAIEGLGPLTGKGSGLLVAAIVGGAVVPELQGILADRIGVHHAFILPVLCYAYITFYALRGAAHRPQPS
jgi:FHS family L-fucose permease-like MFS transporter